MSAELTINEGDTIYDYCWYPQMISTGLFLFDSLQVVFMPSSQFIFSMVLDSLLFLPNDTCSIPFYGIRMDVVFSAMFADPTTSCLLSTSKDHPIHLWDAFSGWISPPFSDCSSLSLRSWRNLGRLRCSYLPFNRSDELESAVSVSFDPTGAKIFSGFKVLAFFFFSLFSFLSHFLYPLS